MSRRRNLFIFVLLTLSLCCNLLLAIIVSRLGIKTTSEPSQHVCNTSSSEQSEPKSPYAGLERDYKIPFSWITDYSSGNEEAANELWEAISIDTGIIALSSEEITTKDLPQSQPFPWDTDMSIYLVEGYHNLHCLKNIHRSLVEFRNGLNQSRSWPHITHCVDALRQDIMCNADDTPRYSTQSKGKATGIGQYRRCRNWAKLEAWTKQHSSCFKFINETDDDLNNLERFKYCPPGSPYTEKVKQYFGDLVQ
ncbi:hypothetical protein EV356DRAFT_468244 [Viridothelium virens]|uniref:Uncharacterized protein n=1 Tax=Viridothelium virens TaxID=1048519 RepID=A0A6A6H6M3_VIRVR|nr:hypothetical protein EV356DRAFT_468244 [Viridothelium virens]